MPHLMLAICQDVPCFGSSVCVCVCGVPIAVEMPHLMLAICQDVPSFGSSVCVCVCGVPIAVEMPHFMLAMFHLSAVACVYVYVVYPLLSRCLILC